MSLAARFLSHQPSAAVQEAPDLEAALRGLLDGARQAWPDLAVDEGDFLRHVAERLPPSEDLAAAVRALHAADLYLACACARGETRALKAFDEREIPRVRGALVRRGFEEALVQEVQQALRTHLLVGEGAAPPRIAGYTGRGALGGWLRTVALRMALNMQVARRDRREVGSDDLLPARAAAPDPELAFLKSHYAREFGDAFEATLAELPAREANVLRLHHIEGMTLEAIAALYRVTARTIRRWLTDTRQRIVSETQRRLQERGELTSSQLVGLMGLLRSNLDVTVLRFLDRDEGGG